MYWTLGILLVVGLPISCGYGMADWFVSSLKEIYPTED